MGKTASNVLHLTLKRVWFEMILYGYKTEEYREIKPYWIKRLCKRYMNEPSAIMKDCFQDFTHITFTNGYAKDAPQFTIECKGLQIGKGRHEWGAVGDEYFVISLGEITNKRNC